MWKRVMLLAIFAIPATAFSQSDAAEDAQRLLRDFRGGRYDALESRFVPMLRAMIDNTGGLAGMRQQIADSCGDTIAEHATFVDEGDHLLLGRATTLTRSSSCGPGDNDLREIITVAGDGRIGQFRAELVPSYSDCHFFSDPEGAVCDIADYQPKTELHLPFKGEWYVDRGGRNLIQNSHAHDDAQRYAIDVLIRKDGASNSGHSQNLADYLCFGAPVLAPAAGAVIAAVRDLPDQAIGDADHQNPAGNHIIIDFGNGEYGVLAHLMETSVTVRPGDLVEAGQQIGACGNSGISDQPHLHFHIQDSPILNEGRGRLAVFHNYTADGQPIPEGEPVRGQMIAPAR